MLVDRFNRDRFYRHLAQEFAPGSPPKFFLDLYDEIPSTNQALWETIAQGQSLPRVAIALSQTAGRGQWGRQWQSARGGLYLSWAIATQLERDSAPQITLWSVWGIAATLREKGVPVNIKWPNDLVVQSRKLGGIKIETKGSREWITHAVIGVGVNWCNPVPEMGITLTAPEVLSDSIHLDSLEAVAACTLRGLIQGGDHYRQVGIDGVLNDYLSLLDNLGQSVTVNKTPGTIIGVTLQGQLRVRLSAPGATSVVHLPPGAIRLGYDS